MTKIKDNSISLNKFISNTGKCSRREADRWIEMGRIMINGKVASKGNRVKEGDQVTIDGSKVKNKTKPIYIALNKRVGITCTTDQRDKDNIIDYVNHTKRIFPIGRLDKETSGLILLTNDGDIVNKILREEHNHEKEYIVTVKQPITPEFIQGLKNGVPIMGAVTKKCIVQQKSKHTFKIILTQGMNRQIRRMCEHFRYRVVSLKRIRIMNITLDKLKVDHWRYLSQEELSSLKGQLKKR